MIINRLDKKMNREYENKKAKNTSLTACCKAGALRLQRRRQSLRRTGVTGGWIFRIEDLRTYKNVDEIVKQLALEYRPTKIAIVEVPEGTILRKSTVGPQEWTQGEILQGSGIQYELKSTLEDRKFQPVFDNINDFFK
ncbi:hypothetical protein FACS1894182_13390 [Bacteroidia bacterium]|nr:hypothetical protein FACS1894182_13390 [Bacteroidia bacterium]